MSWLQASVRSLILASLFAAGGMALAPGAAAVDNDGHCTKGDVTSLQQEGWLGYALHEALGIPSPFPENMIRCQFRLYAGVTGRPVYFCEHDFFMGGIFEFTFYKAFGISRQEGIEDILKFTVTNTLKPQGSDDSLAAAALRVGLIKSAYAPEIGSFVIQHLSFIIKLPPGVYENFYHEIYPGGVWGDPWDDQVTTEVIILPHEIAHSYDLGFYPDE